MTNIGYFFLLHEHLVPEGVGVLPGIYTGTLTVRYWENTAISTIVLKVNIQTTNVKTQTGLVSYF